MYASIVSVGLPAYSRKDATHIYDGIDSSFSPTHVAHMRLGSFLTEPTPWPFDNTTVYHMALQWLKEDRDHRRELEKQGRKPRGARRDVRYAFLIRSHTLTNCFRVLRRIPRLSTRSERLICRWDAFDEADDCFQIRLHALDHQTCHHNTLATSQV